MIERRSIAGLRQADGRDPVEVLPGFFRQNVEGKAALEEYLGLIIPVRRLLKTVFDSKVYQYFVAAAPGLKELMTIGKIWYEVDARCRWRSGTRSSWTRRRPATASSICACRRPRARPSATGLVHREAKRVVDLLQRSAGDRRASVVTAGGGDAGHRDARDAAISCAASSACRTDSLFVNRFHARRLLAGRARRGRRPRGAERVAEPCDALVKAVRRRAPTRRRLGARSTRVIVGALARDRRWPRRRAAVPVSRGVRLRRRRGVGQPARRGARRARAGDAAPRGARDGELRTIVERHDVIVCAGSGGVGKTTIAASIALWGALAGPPHGRADDRPGAPTRRLARPAAARQRAKRGPAALFARRASTRAARSRR